MFYYWLFALTLCCFCLPIFEAGFYNDDAVISLWKARAIMQGQSTFDFVSNFFRAMLVGQGRMAVIYCYVILPVQMTVGDHLFLYRSIHLAMWIVALWSVLAMGRSLGGKPFVTGLPLLLFLVFVQFRSYHDAVLSYFMFFPCILIFGSWTVVFWQKWLSDSNGIYGFVYAPLIYILGLLTSEFVLCFFALIGLLTLFDSCSLKNKLFRLLPLMVVTIIYMSINYWLKSQGTVAYAGCQIGSFRTMGWPYLFQFLSIVPFSYLLFNPSGFMTHWWGDISHAQIFVALIGMGCMGILVYNGLMEQCNIGAIGCRRLSVAGIIFMVTPPLLTAVTAKYQEELRWGLAYLQVILQIIGCVFVLIMFLSCIKRRLINDERRYKMVAICVAIGAGIIFGGHSVANNVVNIRMNGYWKTPRDICGKVLAHYSFDDKQGSPLIMVIDAPWLNRWENTDFCYRYTGLRFIVKTWDEYIGQNNQTNMAPEDSASIVYYLGCPRKMSVFDNTFVVFGILSRKPVGMAANSDWTLKRSLWAVHFWDGLNYGFVAPNGSFEPMSKVQQSIGFTSDRTELYYYEKPISLNKACLSTPLIRR